MGKKANHVLIFGIKIWIFAEPLMFKKEWDRMFITPPKSLIQMADSQMQLNGMLVNNVGESYFIDKLPQMTKEQRKVRIEEEAGGSTWMCYTHEDDKIRYNVVVIRVG